MNIGIVGCGKMATAVALSLHSTNKDINFYTYSATLQSAKVLADKVSGQACDSLTDLNKVDYILLGCKPQQFKIVGEEINKNLDLKNKVVISIMAAVSIRNIQKILNVDNVIRLMPSMPISIGKGISLFYFSENIEMRVRESIVSMFSNISKNFIMETEKQFNQVTTISSSGPAYIYYLMSVFSKKLQDFSLSAHESRELTASLFEGASLMTQKLDDSFENMIGVVTSKAGVTIEAINTFKELNLSDSIEKGIDNAYLRSCELEKSV